MRQKHLDFLGLHNKLAYLRVAVANGGLIFMRAGLMTTGLYIARVLHLFNLSAVWPVCCFEIYCIIIFMYHYYLFIFMHFNFVYSF
jgi:hypothetical protein